MSECPRCKRYRFGVCRCVLFQCAIPWRDEVSENDWQDVYAIDAETAAEEFAERSDCEGDYTIIRNGDGEIWVRDVENRVSKFDISAETVAEYTAHEKTAVTETGNER